MGKHGESIHGRYRKPNTLWLAGDWEGLTGHALKIRLLERLANSEEGRRQFFGKAENVSPPDGCWEWQGSFHTSGYGLFSFSVKPSKPTYIRAHRVSYFLANGELPEDGVLCHTCDNRKCINPAHLFLGTRDDNAKDMVSKNRQAVGQKVYTAKLTPKEVQWLRFLHAVERASGEELMKIFKVNKSTIYFVTAKKFWKHVKSPNYHASI